MDGAVNAVTDSQAVVQTSSVDQTDQAEQTTGDQQKGTAGQKERIYQPFNKKQLDDLVSEANKTLDSKQTNLHYVLHDKLNKYYVQIEDSTTHQFLREIPPKKFMDMYAAIAEKLGLIVNKQI